MVEVYGKKARQINAQEPAHRHLGKRAVLRKRKERGGGKERKKKKLPVSGRGFEPTTLTLEGKAPVG